ncbi:hypothetical protein NIES2119_16320 [[Phormidium ambiguum] IAM M-71]|uniref:Uncharacterized protein n=1 Tax=[Phormidium ambiguum] IAM M-71 TaxID=454136 RepID=A0A1U7IHH6_9CYAN|nr:hypothetical protein [Phormidium ambiguum]OKH36595.1 hypothetical protein NIES2119_16320 [Phormidium ambiguum IAM M-71]
MKPNFEAMTNAELKAYALTHRGGDDDLDALRVLFSRRKPDSETIVFYPPKTKEEEQEQFELFNRIVEEKTRKKEAES